METFLERIAKLPQKKLALLAAELYERSLSAGRGTEPIAITAMGCRMPADCRTPAAFWAFVDRGGDANEPMSDERLALVDPDRATNGTPRPRGTFLTDVDRFDPAVFGISAKEAASMDPQQRILLEVCWEALENAGTPIDELQNSSTGVFVGISNIDYAVLSHASGALDSGYAVTGVANAIAAGRISYVFGFNGPSSVVDTACSASASAIHLACQSLRARECERALAGGVSLALLPGVGETLALMEAVAPDGRCKAFSADADGFGRGEGCGILVLRRLSDAQANGETVLGVILGSAWNQDGRSSGLTAPNGLAQERVIRAALAAANVRPDQISYVEAHGTGTALGDPIEVAALGRVFGTVARPNGPLRIGSVKTNVAHLEAAAGVAGVMKVVLALQRERIPAHLHAPTLNPRIAWSELPIEVPVNGAPWPRNREPRIAGVSSFGFSGTNVHLIVAEAPLQVEPEAGAAPAGAMLLTASAKTRAALLELAARYADALDHEAVSLASFAAAANLERSQFSHRLAVIAADARAAASELRSFAAGDPRSRVRSSSAVSHRAPEIGVVVADDLSADDASALLARWRAFGVQPTVVAGCGNGSATAARLAESAALPLGELEVASAGGARFVDIRAANSEELQSALIELYLGGVALDWSPLHEGVRYDDVTLPNYPFARERHWIDLLRYSTRSQEPKGGSSSAVDEGMYRVGWHPAAENESDGAPAPATIVAQLCAAPPPEPADDFAAIAPFQADLERFAVHSVSTALLELMPGAVAGRHVPDDDPCTAVGVVPAQRRLLERIFRLLNDHGLVRRDATGWTFVNDLGRHDLATEIAGLRRTYPGSEPEINVAARTLELARVLRGEISGVDVLFPNGSFELAEAVYRDTPAARLMNGFVTQAVRALAHGAQCPLRVLEIGAGTGGTTSAALAALPSDTVYLFTDLSTGFFPTARAKFKQHPNVRYEVLDIENRARVEAFAGEPFDLVIAANVLHATASIRRTLEHARMLLRDGGSLVLYEATMSLATVDVTFGTTEGWTKREDLALRPDGPLLRSEQWVDALEQVGFEAAALPSLSQFGVVTDQQTIVLACRRAGSVAKPEDVLIVHRDRQPAELVVALARLGVTAVAHRLSAEPLSHDALAETLAERRPGALIFLGPQQAKASGSPVEIAQRALSDAHDVVQFLRGRADASALWIVTFGAQPAFGGAVQPGGSALWGWRRVLACDSPEVETRIVDFHADGGWSRLAELIANGATGREFAVRGREVRVPHLARVAPAPGVPTDSVLAADGCYIVTGAFHESGLMTSRWLARRGAGMLILAGQTEPDAEAGALIEEVRSRGTPVEIVVADVGSAQGIEAVFERVAQSGRQLRGIVHSATHGGTPNARAAWMLHERSLDEPLDFFILYALAAALTGSPAHATDAAADAFLDALSHHRHARRLPALTVDWDASGQNGRLGLDEERLAVLAFALGSNEPQIAVLQTSVVQRLLAGEGGPVPFVVRDAPTAVALAAQTSAGAEGTLAPLSPRLEAATAGERKALLAEFIRARCAELLYLGSDFAVPEDQPLIDLGLDSLIGLELRNDLQDALGVNLSSTLFFDYPTIGDLSGYLALVGGLTPTESNERHEGEVERVSI